MRVLPPVIKLNGKMCSEGVAACHNIERKDVPASGVAYYCTELLLLLVTRSANTVLPLSNLGTFRVNQEVEYIAGARLIPPRNM